LEKRENVGSLIDRYSLEACQSVICFALSLLCLVNSLLVTLCSGEQAFVDSKESAI
jgi:hypothetical protein